MYIGIMLTFGAERESRSVTIGFEAGLTLGASDGGVPENLSVY
jgi:hypothetical protein